MMTPDAGLKSTPSTSKPSEEDAQPHDYDDKHFVRFSAEQKTEQAFIYSMYISKNKLK